VSRNPATFDGEDYATMAAWLADGTLAADLLAITSSWRGFVDDLSLVDTTGVVAAEADGLAINPAATAAWRLNYGTDLGEMKSLSGDLLSGLPAIMFLTMVVQPHVAIATVYALAGEIRDNIQRLARREGVCATVAAPLARGADRGAWSTWPMIMRFKT
jgi:hypothetical protein